MSNDVEVLMLARSRRRSGATFAFVAMALGAACADPVVPAHTPTEPALTRSDTPPSARWTGERHLRVQGTTLLARLARPRGEDGTPTVVLISGLDVPLQGWDLVQPLLAAHATVFAYDRAGVGGSSAFSGRRPASVVARELRAALEVAKLRPPFVLVAHSIGGVHARVFAAAYPRDVAGLVFLDALHEDDMAAIPDQFIPFIADDQRYRGSKAEVLAQRASEAEVRAAGPLPDVPVAVITSMQGDPDQRAIAFARQGEWARQVTEGVHVASQAGHLLPLEAPAEVVDATRWVLSRIRRTR